MSNPHLCTPPQLADEGLLIVLSAGTQNRPSAPFLQKPNLEEKLMIVASTDQTGKLAYFTESFPGVFWAPGTNIPVESQEATTFRSGTGYSSALAAGVAARIIAEHPDLALPKLLTLMRDTSQEIVPSTGIRILNVKNALEAAN